MINLLANKLQPDVRLLALVPQSDTSGTISFKIDFSLPILFQDSINLDVLRLAYKKSDRRIRIKYTIKLFKVRALKNKNLREISFAKKWVLYWTRDPTILENYRTNIWMLGVNKEGYSEFFNSFEEAKKFLFSISETVTIAASELGYGASNVNATVKAKIWRHTFADASTIMARANPVTVSVIKA
ncbi:MAG: hypothetical protein QXH39_04825 [Conexivisphaerales archaeon]